MDEPHTKIGCEVFVIKDGKVLLGKRKGGYGAGLWGLPGGHLEYDEALVDAACRELAEELGSTVTPGQLRLASVLDGVTSIKGSKGHYLHVTFELLDPDFEPRLMEPEFCEEWRYFALDDLPPGDEILATHALILDNYRAKRLYARR